MASNACFGVVILFFSANSFIDRTQSSLFQISEVAFSGYILGNAVGWVNAVFLWPGGRCGASGGRRFGVDVVSMMSVSVLHTDYWAEEGRPRCCISEEGRGWLVRHARRGGGGPSGRSVCPEGPGTGLKRDRKLRNPRKTRKMVKKSGDLAGKREISGPKTPSGPFFSPRAPSSPRGFGHCRRFLASFASFARTKKWR